MTPETDNEQPIIPPYYLLIVALIGFIVTVASLLQPTFSVVGWGGLGIMLLSLIAWALMAPDQLRALLTGRAVRFGGTSIIITVVFLVMLVAIYAFVRGQNLRLDLTQRDDFSLTAAAREAVTALGGDPTLAEIHLLALYPATMAPQQDSDTLLFEDYVRTSAGKISYEFVDPDRNPQLATSTGYRQPGQVYVTKYLPAEGDAAPALDLENGELVNFNSSAVANPQDELTSAIVRTAITGDVRAYFLNLEGGLTLDAGQAQADSMTFLDSLLSGELGWTTEQVSPFELTAPESAITLNDPSLDGEVLVIPGGNAPLSEADLAFVTHYLDEGGHVVIMASGRSSADSPDLAADPALNAYLSENFGLSFNDDLVLDLTQAFQTPLRPAAFDFQPHAITDNVPAGTNVVMLMPHSIEVSPTPPLDVSAASVVLSGASAYRKTNFDQIFAYLGGDDSLEDDVLPTDEDPTGPFTFVAAAENAATGARVVLISSTAVASDGLSINGNVLMTVNSLTWAASFELNDFLTRTTVQSAQSAADTPVFADESTQGTINFLTLILLPFGILGVGLLVWLNSRERAH